MQGYTDLGRQEVEKALNWSQSLGISSYPRRRPFKALKKASKWFQAAGLRLALEKIRVFYCLKNKKAGL
jgi:hypothetical protein